MAIVHVEEKSIEWINKPITPLKMELNISPK